MTVLTYMVLPLVGSYFVSLCMFWGMRKISGTEGIARWKRLAIEIGFSTLMIAVSLLSNAVLNLLFLVATAFVAKYVNRSGKASLAYNFLLIALVYLTDILVTYMMAAGSIYMTSLELYYIALILVLRLMQFIVIRLLILLTQKKRGGQFSLKQLIAALIIPCFSILNVLTLVIFMQIYVTLQMAILFFVNIVFLLGINLWFALLMDTMSENNRLERELELSRQQARLQLEYYAREETRYEDSKKLLHDIRNHVSALEQLSEQEDKKEALSYAKNLRDMINDLGQTYYTSNRLLNIILNDKAAVMRQKGIRADFKVGEMELSFLQDTDITTIFANLLDNAIAAAEQGGYVKLRVRAVNRLLSISMENSAPRQPQPGKNGYRSSKPGHEGIGLLNIRQAVKRYEGDMHCDWREGIFYTDLFLSMP